MIILGMGLWWVGYTVGFWGYCLVRGYNLSLMDVVSPVTYYGGKKAAHKGGWPPACCPPNVIIPSKATANMGVTCGSTGTSSSNNNSTPANPVPNEVVPPIKGHQCPPGRRWSDAAQGCIPLGFPAHP